MNESAQRDTTVHPIRRGHQERSLGEIVAEIREELKEFLSTRVEMMRTEFRETVRAARIGLPLFVLAMGLICLACLLFTLALVVLVASAFAGSAYAWFFAFIIVGALWMIAAAGAAAFAYNEFRGKFPQRTVEVLKADKSWLQSEVRSQP